MLSKGLLLAVDANSLLHRAYHAYPLSLSTTNGQPVNAVYGFASMFLDAMLMYKPEYVFCAFDTPKPTFRHAKYVGYKANRKEADSELITQIPYVHKVLESMNVPVFSVEGFEADDILGTIANKVVIERNPDITQVRILTGDKDLFQLVNEKVQIIMPQGSFRNLMVYGEDEVLKKMGVTPDQITDLKGLMGDPSDNIPGVRGVGPKTATKLLNTYRSIEEVYSHISDIEKENKRTAKLLAENSEEAVMSKDLATITLEAPVKFESAEAETREFDPDLINELFSHLQFRSLFPRLNKFIELTGNKLSEDARPKKKEVLEVDLDEVLNSFKDISWEEVSLLEKSLLDRLSVLKDYSNSIIIYSQEKLCILRGALKDSLFGANNLSFGMFGVLNNANIVGSGITKENVDGISGYLDIELLSYAMQTGRKDYTLQEDCNEAGLGLLENALVENRDGVFSVVKKRLARELQKVAEYENLERVEELWKVRLNNEKNIPVPIKIAMQEDLIAGFGVALMHHRGVTIDLRAVKESSAEYKEKIDNLEQDIYEEVGFEFNIRSPKQLSNVLFENLNLPHGKKTKTGFSTNEDVLIGLKDAHPVIEKILEFRQLTKLVSTYMDPYVALAHSGGEVESEEGQMSMFGTEVKSEEIVEKLRVHSDFTIMGTSSGRLSSSNPNLQNLPVRKDLGKKIRQFFIPTTGKKLVSIDYSQIDLRVLAHISGDDSLVEAFKNNQDIHQNTASKVFHVDFEDVTSDQRRFAKTINFGLIYGMSSYGLSQSLGISVEEAKKFIDEYFIQFPDVRKYMDNTILFAKEYGYVVSLLGRRRFVAGIGANVRQRAAAAEREAINMPIQGGADDIMRLALNEITVLPEVLSGEMPMVLQVHDEFVFEMQSDEKYIAKKTKKVTEIMENVIKLAVPLRADAEVGESLDF